MHIPYKPNFLERFVDGAVRVLAPRAALGRERARSQFSYGAARRSRDRQSAPMTPYHPNSSVIQRDRITLMMEARNLSENVGFVKGHLQKVQLYAAGHLVYEPDTGDDGADSEISDFLRWWMPRADYGYEHGFAELFGMALMGSIRDGDGLLVWVRDEDGLRLQLVEADQIGELDVFRQQPDYVSGVYFDERGIKSGYRVYDRVGDMRYDNPQFVGAKDAIFLANRIRPGARGITDYETSIKNLKDKFEILEYEKIVVKDISETGVVTYTQRAQADQHDFDDEVINDNGSVSFMRRVEGGLREYLGIGEKFEVVQNNRVSPTFSGFLKALDAESCQGLRLPYGFMVDPSEAGGASIRLIANMASREFVRVQQVMLLPRLEQIRDVLLLDAADRGEISWHPNLLRGQWMFPPPPTADVQRESDIAIKEIRSGMSTWEEQFATWGQTRDRQWKIRKQEIKDRRRLAWEAEQELKAEGIVATVSPDEIAALSDNPVGLSVGREEKGGAITPDPESAIGEDAIPAAVSAGLIDQIGIGGTQALVGILAQVSSGMLPRESAIKTLIHVFGISKAQAEDMVPAQGSEKVDDPEAVKAAPEISS